MLVQVPPGWSYAIIGRKVHIYPPAAQPAVKEADPNVVAALGVVKDALTAMKEVATRPGGGTTTTTAAERDVRLPLPQLGQPRETLEPGEKPEDKKGKRGPVDSDDAGRKLTRAEAEKATHPERDVWRGKTNGKEFDAIAAEAITAERVSTKDAVESAQRPKETPEQWFARNLALIQEQVGYQLDEHGVKMLRLIMLEENQGFKVGRWYVRKKKAMDDLKRAYGEANLFFPDSGIWSYVVRLVAAGKITVEEVIELAKRGVIPYEISQHLQEEEAAEEVAAQNAAAEERGEPITLPNLSATIEATEEPEAEEPTDDEAARMEKAGHRFDAIAAEEGLSVGTVGQEQYDLLRAEFVQHLANAEENGGKAQVEKDTREALANAVAEAKAQSEKSITSNGGGFRSDVPADAKERTYDLDNILFQKVLPRKIKKALKEKVGIKTIGQLLDANAKELADRIDGRIFQADILEAQRAVKNYVLGLMTAPRAEEPTKETE